MMRCSILKYLNLCRKGWLFRTWIKNDKISAEKNLFEILDAEKHFGDAVVVNRVGGVARTVFYGI